MAAWVAFLRVHTPSSAMITAIISPKTRKWFSILQNCLTTSLCNHANLIIINSLKKFKQNLLPVTLTIPLFVNW